MRRQDDRIVDGDRIQALLRRRDQLGAGQDGIGEILNDNLVPMRGLRFIFNLLARAWRLLKTLVRFANLLDR